MPRSSQTTARPLVALILAGLGVLAAVPALAEDGPTVVRVGVIFDGPSPDSSPGPAHYLEMLDGIIQDTRDLTSPDFDVRFPEDKRLSGNWSEAGLQEAIDRLLADPEVDLVVSLGPYATVDLSRRAELPKPVVAAFAIDVTSNLLPSAQDDEGRRVSGHENLVYIARPGTTRRDLVRFREIVHFSRLHILADALLFESLPEVERIAELVGKELGFEIVMVPATDSAAEALARLPEDTEAVYVVPLHRFSKAEFAALARGLIERGIPSFSLAGKDEVEAGLMATIRPTADFERIGRRVALCIQRILNGEKAENLPVVLAEQQHLVVNLRTVTESGFPMPWRTLVEAELVGEEPTGPRLTLDEAVRRSLAANLALRTRERAVEVGYEDIPRARSAYRPTIDLTVGGVGIDRDRAEASFGNTAQQTGTATLGLGQLIYADPALANIQAAELTQRSRQERYEGERLDVALEGAVAFLDVLRSEVLLRVARDNLRLTETNLDLARSRLEIGYSGPSDVYRFESRLATDRRDTIRAAQVVKTVRLQLNRLMNEPLTGPYWPIPPELEDPKLITGFVGLRPFIETAVGGEVFTDFLVTEGWANSPELAALDALIEGQERTTRSARRSYWAPVISLQGEVTRVFAESGAGSDAPAIPGFPMLDDTDWSLALVATLPLYTGGERGALYRQSSLEVSRLRLERATLAQAIELRVRVAMAQVGATYPSIELTRQAADAANRNLELVTDSYSRGVLPIINLLDAQNAAVVADLSASNAKYDFLIDLMELQRAANNFAFLYSDAERRDWFRRLTAYFRRAGQKVPDLPEAPEEGP
jgi:outer membrane protein TolC/ABC-type uncharacterized transport system substrate-binding protein